MQFTTPSGTSATIVTTITPFAMADYVASPVNAGSDDKTDSDATGNYSEYTLSNTIITGIDMPEASEMTYGTYRSANNDSGFMQYQIQITKVDSNVTSKLLEGAEFKLEKLNSAGTVDSNYTVLTGITDVNGLLTFGTPDEYKSLSAGKYLLTETKAAAGYNNLADTITIIIRTDGTITVNGTTDTNVSYGTDASGNPLLKITVTNTPGYDLPNTGGSGTAIFTVIGLVLCGLAGSMLLKRRRRHA